MVEFGEDLIKITGSSRIPWLIWIQLVVLLLLLYSFTHLLSSGPDSDLSPTDDCDSFPCSSSLSSSSSSLHGNPSRQKLRLQVGETTRASCGSSARSRRLNGTGDPRRENGDKVVNSNEADKEGQSSGSSTKGRLVSTQGMYKNGHHPCNIVRLAKVAFLKCLGLDDNSTAGIPDHKSSSIREHTCER